MRKFILYILFWTVVLNGNKITSCDKLFDSQKIIKNFNKDFYQYTTYSDCLLSLNKIDENFALSIDLINAMIKRYGEDSIYVKISYLFLARYYLVIQQIDIADELLSFIEETKENKSYENEPQLNQLLLCLKAEVYDNKKEYMKAIALYEKAFALNDQIKEKNHLTQIEILNRLSGIFVEISKLNKALLSLDKASQLELKLSKDQGRDEKIDTTLLLAKLYEKNKDYVNATNILYDEMNIYIKSQNIYFPKMIELLTQYSRNAIKLNQYIPALFSAKLSLDIQKKLDIQNSAFAVTNYYCMGISEKYLKHNNKAKEYLKKSLNILTKIKMNKKEKKIYYEKINLLINILNSQKLKA